MVIGGSTTSLLSLLRAFDFSRYEVDLLLFSHQGELQHMIPPEVNLLPPASVNIGWIKKALSPFFLWSLVNLKVNGKKSKYGYNQVMAYADAKKRSVKLKKVYDAAIGFMEFWPDAYVAETARAKKKIAWIHPAYRDTGLYPEFDRKAFAKFDTIVTVSEKCRDSFLECFPEYAAKTVFIENILTTDYVRSLGEHTPAFHLSGEGVKFLTVCRLTNASKGLDRGVEVFSRLKREGYRFHWYIVGDGPDREALNEQIQSENCSDCVSLLGSTQAPYPVIKQADVFLLPSRYEGKPMVVTEAQMLGVPVIVTEYSSAREQVRDGIDGLVTANDDEAIYNGLKTILDNPGMLAVYQKNLSETDKSNTGEINKIYEIIDGIKTKETQHNKPETGDMDNV